MTVGQECVSGRPATLDLVAFAPAARANLGETIVAESHRRWDSQFWRSSVNWQDQEDKEDQAKNSSGADSRPPVTVQPLRLGVGADDSAVRAALELSAPQLWMLRAQDWGRPIISFEELCRTIQDKGDDLKGVVLALSGEKKIVLENMLVGFGKKCALCSVIPGRLDTSCKIDRLRLA